MLSTIPQRWWILSGQNNWKDLLDPLDSDLQDYLIHYGAMSQATYDNFNSNRESEYAGCSIYSRKNMFDKVGLDKGNPFKYRVVKYIYATSGIALPESFLCKSLSGKTWSRDSNWIGYVAVATDEGKLALGRRDILVAWRGTIMPMEWVNDFEAPLVPATKILGKAGENANVHQGFLSLYVSSNVESSVTKTSARDQVLSEVQKQVDNRHNMPSSSTSKNPCPVTAFNFGCPRSGDSDFKAIVDSLHDLHILKVSNVSDIVPRVPPRIPPFFYAEVGEELMIDSTRSPYLKSLSDFTSHHNLEGCYLHPLAIAKGLEIKRDIALANKEIDALKAKYLIPKSWRCQENNGMVQQDDGSWKLQDHEKEDFYDQKSVEFFFVHFECHLRMSPLHCPVSGDFSGFLQFYISTCWSSKSRSNANLFCKASKFQAPNRLATFMMFCCITCIVYLLACIFVAPNINTPHFSPFVQLSSTETQLEHVVFGIASDKNSWNNQKEFVRLWWRPSAMRGCVFLDSMPRNATTDMSDAASLPPICISEDTSSFRYTYSNGPRSFIRVARVVSETVALNHSNVRWFVFGDDHTIFFPENLLKTLSKYDHELWYYIGTNSENYAQNKMFSFEMAFGGAGFAISYPLAKVLAKILDSCLERYPHLYGSDGRIHACTSELGVSLTHEPGFHQMDIRGSMFGLLASHPLRPLVSIHHWEATDPIFPQMTQIQAMKHLFLAVKFDSQRIVQQTICYDRWFSWTISISWGYAVQIFSHHIFLRDALRTQETYFAMKNGSDLYNLYSVETMEYPKEPCRRAPVFFLHDVFPDGDRIMSIYRMKISENCTFDSTSPRKLQEIRVFSDKLELNFKQLQAPRRQCCDVLNSSIGTEMEIAVRGKVEF